MRPRSRAGANSAAYRGAATDATPTPNPTRSRPTTSTYDPGARLSTMAPMTKSTAANTMVSRRPRRSASPPATKAPAMAPRVTQLVITSSSSVPTENCF